MKKEGANHDPCEESNERSQCDDWYCGCLIVTQVTISHLVYESGIDKGILLHCVAVVVPASFSHSVTEHILADVELGRMLASSNSQNLSNQVSTKNVWHACNEKTNVPSSLVVRIY